MWPGPRPTSISSGILIHPAVWPQQTRKQNGVCARLREGELGPRRTQYGQGRGLPPCEVSSRSTQPFGHNRHGPWIIRTKAKPAPKNFECRGCCAPFRGGSCIPILHSVARAETYPHAKFHLDLSNRLATVHQRHRQTGQDRTDRQTGQWSNRIGRTVLQTVAQKSTYDFLRNPGSTYMLI